MKKRYLYSLLFLVPGAILSLIAAVLVTGAAAGFFWLFILGDSTWPTAANKGLALLPGLTFTGVWIASIIAGFVTGKKLEKDPALNKQHIVASLAVTIILLGAAAWHQLSVGNIGKKHDSVICGDYCSDAGYSSSGMPARDSGDDSCICYDGSGHEVIRTPMAGLRSAGK